MILGVPGCPLYFGHFLLFCCILKYPNSVPTSFTEYWKCLHVQTHTVMPCIFSASVTPLNNLQKEDCRVRRTIVCFYLQTSKSQGLDKSRQNHDISVNSNLRALFSCPVAAVGAPPSRTLARLPGPSFETPSEGFLQTGGLQDFSQP